MSTLPDDDLDKPIAKAAFSDIEEAVAGSAAEPAIEADDPGSLQPVQRCAATEGSPRERGARDAELDALRVELARYRELVHDALGRERRAVHAQQSLRDALEREREAHKETARKARRAIEISRRLLVRRGADSVAT